MFEALLAVNLASVMSIEIDNNRKPIPIVAKTDKKKCVRPEFVNNIIIRGISKILRQLHMSSIISSRLAALYKPDTAIHAHINIKGIRNLCCLKTVKNLCRSSEEEMTKIRMICSIKFDTAKPRIMKNISNAMSIKIQNSRRLLKALDDTKDHALSGLRII